MSNETTKNNMEKTPLGWIGTGIMGRSMAGHLLKAGYPLSVFNRTKSKADDLLDRGALWCDSPREVAQRSKIVFVMVGYPADVRETILGVNGVLAGLEPGGIVVDMTTSSPSLAQEIEKECLKKNVISLDAPVSGGDIGAKNATLSIMVGGDQQAFEQLMPLWNILGKTVVYQGVAGSGQHTKMVNQILIAGNMMGMCEALMYARKSGLDPVTVLESVSGGAAGSWSLSNLGPRILAGDFAPGFMVEHFVKDLGIALDEARRMNLALPGLALAEQLYSALQTQGHGRSGTQALMLHLAEQNAAL